MRAIDLFSKYAWVVHIKDKRRIAIVNAFEKIVSKGRKPNKIWVDQGGDFYNNFFERFFKINDIEMYSTYNESVSAERFVRMLKNRIFKHMTAASKKVYFDVLDDIVHKYNNTVHRTIKMKRLILSLILIPNTIKTLMKKITNLKLVIMSGFQITKTFLLKDTLKIGQKKILLLVKLRIQFRGITLLVT